MYLSIEAIGNLGRDPEMRFTGSGMAVTSFNVATSRKYTGANGQPVKETTWLRCSVWGKQAEACNTYLKKGSKVFIEGRLNPDLATGGPKVYDKADHTKGASFDVTANIVRFLDSKEAGTGDAAQASPDAEAEAAAGVPEQDIAF